VLDVRVHDEELRRLEADPLARGAEITLLAAAALGMALAIGGLLLTTQGGVTDERSTLYDLEAQGVAPATLRRQIRLRSALVAVLGAIGGLAMGLVLAHFTVQLVTISAGAEPPDPPLRGAGATLLLAAMLAVYAAGSAVAVLLPHRPGAPRARAPATDGGPAVTAVDVRDLFRVHRTEGRRRRSAPGVDAAGRGRRDRHGARPQRVGQEHAAAIAGGARAALGRRRPGVRPGCGADGGPGGVALPGSRGGIVDQHYDRALSPDLSCEQIVALQPALLGIPERERHARAGELLARVGLAGAAGSRPDRLSGGERQRVAVCAALAHRPRLLLADEPSGELDAASAAGVYALIRELAHEAGTTVVLVSHDPGSVEIADRAVRIRDGRVAEEVRRDGREWAVIGHGGWVRIPPAMLVEGASQITPGSSGTTAGWRSVPRPAARPPRPPSRRLPAQRPQMPARRRGCAESRSASARAWCSTR
jgi:energy-coupling factor transporter ATP-binding protein EcfA2